MSDDDGFPPERFEDAEEWLPRAVAGWAARSELDSWAATYHDGQLSALVETPQAVAEDIDHVERVLRRFLPQLRPDQVIVLWPAAYQLDGRTHLAVQAHLGEAAGNHWRTLVSFYPDPEWGIDAGPIEIDPPNPFARRLRRTFSPGARRGDGLVRVPPAPGFQLYVRPGGPLDGQLLPTDANARAPGARSAGCRPARVRLRP